MSNEQTANEGFYANILHAPGDKHIVSNEGSDASSLKDLVSNDDLLC